MQYDDDWAACARTRASLLIRHSELDPESVTGRLGLSPTSTWRRSADRQRPKKVGGWELGSKFTVESRDLRRHLDWLIETIGARDSQLQAMQAEGLEVVVSCFWASSEGHGGPELHPAAMLRFGQLNIPIRFDIYFEGED